MLPNSIDTLISADAFTVFGVVVLSTFVLAATFSARSNLPLINDKKRFEIRWANARQRYVSNARNLISSGFEKSSRPFRIISDNGCKLVFGPEYANELRNNDALSLGESVKEDFHGNIPGFDAFKQGTPLDHIFLDAVRIKLTQALGRVTKPLSEETTDALKEHWTDNTEWHDFVLKSNILNVVAQLSSRVFLGENVCKNPDWLRITIEYTVHCFMAAQDLRLWPKITRPIVSWFLPSCRRLREEVQEARDIIEPVLEQRRKDKESCIREGRTPERYLDSMEWMDECAKGLPYDPAAAQLAISLAAIHTTSDMLTQVLYDLCGKEDLIKSLREEIISVLQENGWKKTALYKLKLMDSMLKESQRMKPLSIATMKRKAVKSTQLSDGTQIPKGSSLMVSCHSMWDPSKYANPETFDAYRFLKLREDPAHQNTSHLVSVSPDHLSFGLGKHACPGRFFAANELKVALCHILLKYDFKLVEETKPMVFSTGLSLHSNPFSKLAVRRRQEEIPL